MHYRADIDGLRAIAVLSVVLFHVGFETLGGGFVGVDIFFVISGYLITKIITGELDKGEFSIVRFYERRARRILPALFAMMAVITLLTTVMLIPSTYEAFGESVVAASLSLSNVLFWLRTGYFDPDTSRIPLLHTWSLGVEEQFYLAFPLFLMIVRRHSSWSWAAMMLPVFALSLVFSIVQVRTAPEAAFYLPFARIWELMVGSLLAVQAVPALQRRSLNEGLSALGLAMLLIAIFGYSEDMTFPGDGALLPCLGAGLLIYSNASGPTAVGRLLSCRPMVFIGLISYSLYLWHWPIIVLAKSVILQRDLTTSEALSLLVVIAAISIVSWRFVERPFRHATFGFSRGAIFRGAAVGTACFVAFGLTASFTKGIPDRFAFSPLALRSALAATDTNPLRAKCDSRSIEDVRDGDVCRIGDDEAVPSFAVIGDSFGDAMIPGVDAAAERGGDAGLILTRSGCNPLLGIWQKTRACRPFMDAVGELITKSPEIRTVLVIGRWTRIAEGTRFGFVEMADAFITDDQTQQPGYQENRRVFQRAIERMDTMFEGRRLVFVAYFPEQHVHVPQAALVDILAGGVPDEGVSRSVYDERQSFVRRAFSDMATRLDFSVLDIGRLLCDARECRATENGVPLYADDNHLNRTTAIALSGLFDPVFVEHGPTRAAGDGGNVDPDRADIGG
ncbi:acyltransferase family protein [Marinivivus vitaminiproducens]|uniref:acyltransferase family protein n=1 Tax=Marinivivus vitaminiproducens TaxID=3035935 RepID=UPI0027A45392|nr:acyltransferase family protein [Geminicoccaceae bacterium SCSIO 64248]